MKISMNDVNACKMKIQGLTAEDKQPIGTIDLPVELGERESMVVHI